jgi:predicted nucleic acid-binding protein
MAAMVHRQNLSRPIEGPNDVGEFPGAFLAGTRMRGVPPVVADANILCRDVLRACRYDQRTILVNATNSGMIRLYVARHVLDEVVEHAADWTGGTDVTESAFVDRWQRDYLPLLRMVEVEDGLLSQEELDRIALLDHGPSPKVCDPDDVPTATLALQLGAFLLSRDKAALRAVYGADVDFARHDEWVAILGIGGDAGALGSTFQSTAGGVLVAGYGAFAGLRWLWQHVSPWAVIALAALGTAAMVKAKPKTREKIAEVGASILEFFAELYALYQVAEDQFLAVAPAIPSWASLASEAPKGNAVLTRACLHTLARTATGSRSAEELADELPPLAVSSHVKAVRSVLRGHACFKETYRGRWQVGEACISAE